MRYDTGPYFITNVHLNIVPTDAQILPMRYYRLTTYFNKEKFGALATALNEWARALGSIGDKWAQRFLSQYRVTKWVPL